MVNPALAKALLAACTGPIPMMRGSTPTAAEATIRANGFKLCILTPFSEAMSMAAEPSLSPDELPAVTVPSFLKAGLSFANPSMEVWGFKNSSSLKMIGSAFRWGISTGTISFSKVPSF